MNLPALSAIYNRYETFSRVAQGRFSGSLAGRLFLRSGLDVDGLTSIVAASIAGACALCVEPDAELLREALRAGLCDFVVGPLDEALRILKNEIRRGLPISVGVTSDPGDTLPEMIGRGLQPDIVSLTPEESSRIFIDRGAVPLPGDGKPAPDRTLLEWALAADAARSMPQIAHVAAQALDLSRADAASREHWLHNSARHLGRAFSARSCVRMSLQESAAFVRAARAQFPAIRLTRDGTVL